MANEEHRELIKQGVKVWNRWRREHPEIRTDLSFVNLIAADLIGTNLQGANLRGANLMGPD